jgi:hypothetical protein
MERWIFARPRWCAIKTGPPFFLAREDIGKSIPSAVSLELSFKFYRPYGAALLFLFLCFPMVSGRH